MSVPLSVLRWQSQGSKSFVQTGLDTALAGLLKYFLNLCLPVPLPVLVATGFHIPAAFHPSLCGLPSLQPRFRRTVRVGAVGVPARGELIHREPIFFYPLPAMHYPLAFLADVKRMQK